MTQSEQLYNSLLNKGYTEKNLGDRDTFLTMMQDKKNRRKLYDFISKRGDFRIGNYENYEQRIASDYLIPQPLQENIAIAKSNPMDKVNPALRTQSTKPVGDVQASQNIGNKAALTFEDVEPMPEASAVLQRNADATTSQDAIQQAISQDLIGQAASQEWQRDTEQHYKSEKERLQELYNKEMEKVATQPAPNQFFAPGMVKTPENNRTQSREAYLLQQAIQYINDAEHHISNVRNDAGLAQGVSDAIFDIDTLTLGLDSLSKNATLKAILDKADADQPLTEAEESLLNAALYKQFTEAALPNGRWYNIGKGIGENIPYMLEFALSGGVAGALTKGASKAIGKQVVKYINNLALKNGSKIAKRTVRNVFTRGSRMLGNTLYQLPGGVMRAAVQVPLRSSVYNDIIERQIGTLGYNPGEDGTLDYTGRIDADNTADAITKGLTSGFITNLTESVGGEGIQFITNKIGGLMGKGISAVAKDFRSPRWYNHIREGLRRNGLAQFISASSLQGPVAEWGEEILDQTLNAIFVGDSSLDPNSENYVFDLDNLIDTAITTGAISLFMGAAGGIASGKIHRDVNKAYALAKKNIDTLHYTDTEINALNNIATSRPQEASKWVSSITRTMRTLAIRSAEIENSLSPEARTLTEKPYTDAEFNELSPYDQQAVLALEEIKYRFNDLSIQRDYVVAGINYNALSKGLKESVAPQAEAAMADIQANALRDSDYTVKVTFRGQDGYLVSGTADIDNLPDGRTVATLPAGNIYQVRTKSPDGQWIIQQAVAEDIVPGSVTPTQQLIDETTARIYTPVQNLINAEQAQAQAEVAQAQPSVSTPASDQVSDQVATQSAAINAPTATNSSLTSEQVSEQVSDQVATPPSGLNAPVGSPTTEQTTSPSEGRVEGSSPSMTVASKREPSALAQSRPSESNLSKANNPQQTEGAVGGIEALSTAPSVQTGTSTYTQIAQPTASDQVSDQVATQSAAINAPTATNSSLTSEQVSEQVSDQVATPPSGLNAPTAPNGSTQSTQAKLAHIASWQQAIDVPIVIFHDISEVDNPQAVANIQAGNTTPGWIANDTVYIYLPHAKDERDIDSTIMHECIAHFGIPRLFATQEQADAFYDEVWNAMPEAEQYRLLSYPGVSHLKGEKARRVAADEYIAHLAEQIRAKRAGEAEVSLWQRIVSFFRNALRRANVNLRLNDTDLTQLLLQSLDALKKNNEQPQDTTSVTALDPNEVAVTLPSNGTETRFSIRSFREEGRAKVTKWLDSKVIDKDITRQEAQDIIDQLDTIYDICQEYTTQYAPFGDWSEAQVNVDANGNPVLSVIKSNGEYAMNLDFSLVCKKRRTLDAVFQEMIARDIINDFELDGVQVAKVNEIIRSYGFETACRLCFVDAKRFRIAAVADTFVELFNEISSMSDRKLRQVINAEPTTVRGKAAQLLLNDTSQRIKVSRSDFMSAEGFERIKRDYPEIMKLYNSKKGTGGPKASFGDVQYLNDIENTSWTPDKAYAVGGVRLQSFSDYVPRMVFDYVQMIADLTAKRLPVHAYTKEDIFAKQFGLTGIKINLSLVPRVDPDGMAPGLDRDGNYVWQEGETFPYDTAIAIQNAPGYRDNCGTIAVGVSDAHILKMLDDENIRMVIPYHKSGLNPAVAIFNNIDAFVDYTNEQNTRYESGSKLSKEDSKNHFNFNEALRKAKGNPRIAAQQYLDWCRNNNYLPKFDKFASHPNYYKLLEDFTTMYTVDGVDTVVPQHAVEMRFPTEQDAFGSMRDLIAEGLEADAILEGQRNEQLSAIVDEIAATLPQKTTTNTIRFRSIDPGKSLTDYARAVVANGQQTTTPTGLNAPVALATANDKNKLPGTPIRFRMTRRTESTVNGWINRRTDLTPDERKAVIDHIDNLDGTTLQLATAKWFAQGTIRIPEDNIQVEQAIKIASRAKVDPLAYDYPQAIISAFPDMKPKGKPINPDDVPTLTNKQELPNGITVYNVDESRESQQAIRDIIDTHLGTRANPWCITSALDGNLTDESWEYWESYSAYPKRIAFHDGKVVALFASDSAWPIWWDTQDRPHYGIPLGANITDGEYNEETNTINTFNEDGDLVESIPATSFRSINPGESLTDYARAVVANSPETRFRTSSEIEAEYPNWLDGTTTDSGKHFTQVEGTRKTYKKVGDWIEQNLGKDITILDASSGMGYGTADLRERGFNIDDVEPYQSEERRQNNPATFDSYDSIDKQYDFIISNAVLNVIPDDWRAGLLHDMAVHLAPGGRMFINTRKAGEEKSIKDKIELDSPQEILVKRNGRIASYQRFFTPSELKEWVQQELGEGYTVEIANKANSGTSGLAAVVVTKNNNPRFRSIAADNRTANTALDSIEQATADYADTLNTEHQAIIDAITPAPGDSLRTIAEKTRLRSIGRMVTRDNASMHLFDTLCNDVLANAARKNDKNALNAKRTSLEEKFTDNKVRVNQLLDKIQQGGGYIRPEDNYWYRENAHKASAQALSRLFKAKYESRLFEALAPIIRLLAGKMNIPAPKKGFIQNVKRGMRNTTERWYETLHQLADYLPFDKLRDSLLKSINDKLDDLNHTDYGRLYLTASYYMQAVTALERQKVKQEGKIAEQQTIIEDAKILADSQLIDVDKRIEEVQRSAELTDEEKAAQIDRLRLEKIRITQTLEDTINEANEAMDVINEADYGGLAGVQYAIFDLYGMINENVEAIKGDRQKLTVLAQELEIPTVEEFVKQVEDVIGSSQDANSSASQLWDAVRAISEYELETSYIAGLISRSGYQALTYNTDFDGLLKERYNQQKKAILDHPGSYENINKYDKEGNLKSTRKVLNDNARIALDKLNQEYAEAIDAIPMPGKNGSWQHLIDTGWLTQQEVDNIHRKYEHYLPLKGHAEMTAEDRNEYESHTPKNQSTIREAKGHTQLARDVITQIVQDALGTIQAAERNKALTLLYKTLTNNQDLAVAREQYKIQLTYYTLQRGEDGKMHQVPYGDINENGVYERMVPTAEQLASGEVFTAQGRKQIANIDIPITNDQRDEHSVSVRINGEDYTMFFYDKRIADAITGRNNNYPEHVILKTLSWLNKKMAAFITSLSPAFQLGSNMWRDIQEMFSNTIIDQGLLTALKALGNRFNQLIFGKINKAVYRYQIGKLTPETARTATEKLVVEYFVNGGPVNITQLPDYDTVKLNVRNDLLQYLTTGKMPSDNNWLSRIAERVELASRISVYIASRNIGKSVNEAIINSKEATVNFDRKGTEASLWGSYIMFFNAIMQGVRRQVQLWRNHPARALATYGFISLSITPLSWMISHALQQLICLITGDDDEPMSLDEMMEYYYSFSPEYRQRNFILILGRDDSIRLPLALNYLPFSTIGDSFYRLMFDKNRRDDAKDVALDVLSAFLETYTPVGQPLGFAVDAIGADTPKEKQQAIKSAVGSVFPPVLQPVAQNAFNYNFMGGQLYNEPFDENDNEPYYLNPKAHTQDIYINISQWLSNASGGDEAYAGDINIHPEEIENFFGLFGFFSEATEQVLSVISMATDGEDNTLNDYWKSIPVLSRFTAGSPAEYKDKSLQGMFYNDKEELDRFKNIREAYIGTKKYDERVLQQYSPDEQRYFADLATMESISKKIRKEIKAATPEGEAPKYHEDERLKAIYNLANEQYHSLASGEYKPVDDPYYTYMYIKDQIEKTPYRTADGSYRLLDLSGYTRNKPKDDATHIDVEENVSKTNDEAIDNLVSDFRRTTKMLNRLPSGYYPGIELDKSQSQDYDRFQEELNALKKSFDAINLNNLFTNAQ